MAATPRKGVAAGKGTTAAKATSVAKPATAAKPATVAKPAAAAKAPAAAKPATAAKPAAAAKPPAAAKPAAAAKPGPATKTGAGTAAGDLESRFEAAAAAAKQAKRRPDNATMLKLYSYYKQATEGDARGARPGGFDFVGAAKYDAWAKLKGVSRDDAMTSYIKQVERLNRE